MPLLCQISLSSALSCSASSNTSRAVLCLPNRYNDRPTCFMLFTFMGFKYNAAWKAVKDSSMRPWCLKIKAADWCREWSNFGVNNIRDWGVVPLIYNGYSLWPFDALNCSSIFFKHSLKSCVIKACQYSGWEKATGNAQKFSWHLFRVAHVDIRIQLLPRSGLVARSYDCSMWHISWAFRVKASGTGCNWIEVWFKVGTRTLCNYKVGASISWRLWKTKNRSILLIFLSVIIALHCCILLRIGN